MHGTLWIASYVVLCCTTLGLALAVLSLFQLLSKRGAGAVRWPLPELMPGSELTSSRFVSWAQD